VDAFMVFFLEPNPNGAHDFVMLNLLINIYNNAIYYLKKGTKKKALKKRH